MKIYWMIAFLLILPGFLGCQTVYTSTYGVAVEERSVKTIASDQKIKLTIQQKFLEDNTIKILDISTFCYNGNVYLVGEYGARKQRERAMEIATGVPGAKSVTPYLLPKRKGDTCGTTDNITIAAKVNTKLIADKDIWSTNIDVKVVQCTVVLLGIVGSEKEISKAVAHAKSVGGVRDVISYLKSADTKDNGP